jgi:hypothetical protein
VAGEYTLDGAGAGGSEYTVDDIEAGGSEYTVDGAKAEGGIIIDGEYIDDGVAENTDDKAGETFDVTGVIYDVDNCED